jgi:hypothetical protein
MNNNDDFQTERSKQHILPGEERERCYRILARMIARSLLKEKHDKPGPKAAGFSQSESPNTVSRITGDDK